MAEAKKTPTMPPEAVFKLVTGPKSSKRVKVTMDAVVPINNRFETTIRIGYPMPKDGQPVNLITMTKKVLNYMWKCDKHLQIKPTDLTMAVIENQKELPISQETFAKTFKYYEEKQVNDRRRMIVAMNIRSSIKVNAMKFECHHGFLQYLQKESIKVQTASFGTSKEAHVGFIAGAHPRLTFRANLEKKLKQTMEEAQMDSIEAAAFVDDGVELELNEEGNPKIPDFQIRREYLGYGKGTTRVATEALAIKCDANHHKLLCEMMVRAFQNSQETLEPNVYLPPGLPTMIGETKYKNILRQQRKMIEETASIHISGLTEQALHQELRIREDEDEDTIINTTLEQVLGSLSCQIEETNDKEEGKWLLVVDKDYKEYAVEWIDENLPEIYKTQIPDYPGNRIKGEAHPRRTYRRNQTRSTTSYAESIGERAENYQEEEKKEPNDTEGKLKSNANTPERRSRTRQSKTPSHFVWNPVDFPPPTSKKTRTTRADKSEGQHKEGHTTNTSSTITSDPTSTLTPVTTNTTSATIDIDAMEARIITKLQEQEPSKNQQRKQPPDIVAMEARITASLQAQLEETILAITKSAIQPTYTRMAEITKAQSQAKQDMRLMREDLGMMMQFLRTIAAQIGVDLTETMAEDMRKEKGNEMDIEPPPPTTGTSGSRGKTRHREAKAS